MATSHQARFHTPNTIYANAMSMFHQEEPEERQAYSYSHPLPPAQQRPYSGNGTSSAFSASALPHEDWTQIADLAERRRIQNRIAQRNYRKKLKRRLEDLERRAGSNEPEDAESEKKASPPPTKSKRASPTKASKTRQEPYARTNTYAGRSQAAVTRPESQMHLTPPLESNDDYLFAPAYARHNSHTPPLYPYSNAPYPPPEEALPSSYGSTSPYQAPVTSIESYAYPAVASMASTVPSMTHFNDAYKRESLDSDAGFNQFSNSNNNIWPYWNAVDPNAPYHYDRSNAATPPLSHSFDQSANCSETGLDLPTTPLSMPESPDMMPHMLG